MRAADGDDLPRQLEQKLPRERIAADRPDGLAHARGCTGHGDERHVLLPDRAADIVADLGIDPASPASGVKRFDARGPATIVFSEHQTFDRTRLHDHARLADRAPDIGDAAHERVLTDDRPQHVVLLHTVLEGNDGRRRLHEREQLARGSLGIPQLNAEHHHIDRADGFRIVAHVDVGQMHRVRPAFDREPALAHGGKMCAARDEMDVGATLHEPRAEIAADTARSHDRNSHRALRAQAGDQYCGNAIRSMR